MATKAVLSPKHNMFVVPYREDLIRILPGAMRFPTRPDFMAVPHELDHTRLFRNIGYDVPAPILTQYNWAGGKPYAVQRNTAALLTTNPRAYVLNGMGTGKTKSAIWAYDYLRSKGHARKMLVVAPLSTLNFTWLREIFVTAPHLKAVVLHGTAARRRKRLADMEQDVYIINPDGLSILADEINDRDDIDTLVIDELAMFRNGGTSRAKLMTEIARYVRWCWGMTGSPTPQSPTDAWGQCRIVTPDTVPKYFGQFRDKVQTRVTQFKFKNKDGAADVVIDAMRPAVRYTLDDVIELPECVERTVDVDLGARQKKVYEELRKAAVSMIGTEEITAVNAAAVLNKLLQVSLGYVYTKERNVIDLDPDNRLDAMMNIINDTDRKVIVFSPYTHALGGIVTRLGKEGVECAKIDGSVSVKDRSTIFPLFQNTDKYKVLAAHPVSMSHGLTLTAADTIIWFGPTTSLETFEQANARIRRIGQKHKQQIIMLQSTAAERRIYTLLRGKQKVQDAILELFAFNTGD